MIQLTVVSFSNNCADIISTRIQLKCLQLSSLSFHYFLMERVNFLPRKNFCFRIFFSTQFSTCFSSFLKVEQQRYFPCYYYHHIWVGNNLRIIFFDTILFVIYGKFKTQNRLEINHIDTALLEVQPRVYTEPCVTFSYSQALYIHKALAY